MSEPDSTTPVHKVSRQALRMSGPGTRAAYYSTPTFVLSCTCGWRAETTVERHAQVLTDGHLAGNTEPTGWRITSTSYGTEIRQM